MKKIKIFEESIVDLRGSENTDTDFKVNNIEKKDEVENSFFRPTASDVSSDLKSTNLVRVRFDKFISLISRYDLDSALVNFMGQEVIISTDLLADLANPPEMDEEKVEEKKFPFLILLTGIVFGVFLTWLIFK